MTTRITAISVKGVGWQYRLALAGTSVVLIATLLLVPAHAQTAVVAPGTAATVVTTPMSTASRQVGDATRSLLEKQRAGSLASEAPHPIAGEVAQRSYERYLRSFERPIPESFTSVASPVDKVNK